MSTVIALCCDIVEFQGNRCLDKNWCRRFPGASWTPSFADMASKEGLTVVSGDIALYNVKRGYWDAEEIFVIQELNASHGRKLIRLGAEPAILTCFESPLIAYSFYDQLYKIAPHFKNRILYSGAFKTFQASSGLNYPLCFPNYYPRDVVPLVPWDERGFLVMVAANKHWQEPFHFYSLFNPKKVLLWIWEKWRRWRCSPTRSLAIKNELQSKRLEAIAYFTSINSLTLYGHGWNELQRLPSNWRKRLNSDLKNLNPQPCEDKFKTISGYKFAICFENVSYPGYITEKIIDCFVAGAIPIYLGAPDVQDFIPKESFVDMREFDSWERLNNYLDRITEDDALKILSAGRDFLNSSQGKLYSNEGFAQFVIDILLKQGYTK